MDQLGRNGFFQNTCIDFSANVNFLPLPETVMQAARSGLVAQADPQEQQAGLEERLAEWNGVKPAQVYCGSGVAEVAGTLMQVLKPQKALLPAPGLEEYLRALSMVKCSTDYYYTEESAGFRISAGDFCSRITPDTDMVFLCNPNNPTAVLYEKAFVETVLRRCQEADARLVLDESSLDLVEDAERYSMKSAEMSPLLFIMKDITRMFALPGIRLGYGLCTDADLMERLRGAGQSSVSRVAERAGTACAGEREFMRKTVQEMTKERTFLIHELKQLGLDKVTGEANMVFFASRPRLHVFGLLHGVMLRDCSNYEGLGEGYYRITVRSREENEKLLGVLKEWQSQNM